MTDDEYNQMMRERQTEQLRQMLQASSDPMDQQVFRTDPKFAGVTQGVSGYGQPEPQGLGLQSPQQPMPPGTPMDWGTTARTPQPQQDKPYYRGPGGRILQALGYTTPVSPLAEHVAGEMYPGVRLTDGEKRQLGAQAIRPEAIQQRQTLARQLLQDQETRRQHDLQLLEKAMNHPRGQMMLDQLAQTPGYSAAPQAQMLAKAWKDGDHGSWQAYKQFIPQEIQQRFVDGTLPHQELTAWLDYARESAKFNAKEEAKATILKQATDTPPEKRTPYQNQLILDHQSKLDKEEAETFLKNAQGLKTYKEYKEGSANPDRRLVNAIHTANNHGIPFEQGTEASQKAALAEYFRANAQGRQDVQLGAPIEQKTRTNLYTTKGLQNLNLERAPEGISEGEARRGGYVQLSDGEEKALTEYRVAKKTADSMFSVADRLITAKNPAEAAGQFARLQAGARTGSNGLAGAYLKDLEAFSSRIARLVEVGVMTNVDVTRWSNTFGSFGDTKQVLEAKKALFYEIQGEAERLLKMKLTGKPVEEQKTRLDDLLTQVDAVAEGKGRKKGFKGMSEQELQQKRKELFK